MFRSAADHDSFFDSSIMPDIASTASHTCYKNRFQLFTFVAATGVAKRSRQTIKMLERRGGTEGPLIESAKLTVNVPHASTAK
jgi:hypothetical protein